MYIFLRLIQEEVMLFKFEWFSRALSIVVPAAIATAIAAYVMPKLGLSNAFGRFIFTGLFVGIGFFDTASRLRPLVRDISGPQSLAYKLALPLPPSSSLIAIPLGWALTATLLSFLLLPIGALILPKQLIFSRIEWIKLIPMLSLANLLYAFTTLWLGAVIRHERMLTRLWPCAIAPLWLGGSFLFTWTTLQGVSASIGTLMCLNPLTFIMEGARSAAFDGRWYLPYTLSLPVLILFLLFFAIDGVRRMRRRLDVP
jgi:ABC-type polysaccharide/polyol phosphate export permease